MASDVQVVREAGSARPAPAPARGWWRRRAMPGLSLRIRAFIILALGLITISRLAGFAAAEDGVLSDDRSRLQVAARIQDDHELFRLSVVRQQATLNGYLLSGRPSDRAALQAEIQAGAAVSARLADEIPPGLLRGSFAEVAAAAADWQDWAALQRPQPAGPEAATITATGARLMAAFDEVDGRFNGELGAAINQLSKQADERQRYDLMAIAVCAVVAALAMLMLSYLVILAVVRPIARLAGQARELAADFAMPLAHTRRRDEIGDLERAINAYREAMAERLATAHQLAEQEARFRLVFDRAPLGMCRLGVDGAVLETNPALRSMLGYSLERVQRLNLHRLTHPDDHGSSEALFAAAAEGSSVRLALQSRLLTGSSNWLWCSLTGAAVRDAQGRPLYFVAMVEDISDRKGEEMLLQHQAEHDPLTGLPNRALFFSRLSKLLAAAEEEPFAVCVVDLDGFKQVNDERGHPAGDRLLQLVAGRLREKLRVTDTVARLGGDEFAALLPGTDETGALAAAGKVLAAAAAPFEVAGAVLEIGASIGVAVHPADGDNSTDLMRAADRAMYAAKRDGGGRAARVAAEVQAG